LRIGISEEPLRYENVEKSDPDLDDEGMIGTICELVTQEPNEFVILKKSDGGLLAVPGRAIRFVETDGLAK
jgi:hypothetical protein